MNSDLGEVYHCGVAAMSIDGRSPFPRHLQANSPLVLSEVLRSLLRNIVAVVNDDRDPGELHEIRHRHANGLQIPELALHWRRDFAFRKNEVAARLIGDHCTDIGTLDDSVPPHSAAVRMGDEYSISDLVEQRRNGIRVHFYIDRTDVGRHLAEVLVQSFRVLGKLDARVEVRPYPNPEHIEPELLVGCRRYGPAHGGATGIASAGLVKNVHTEAPAQENGLIAFASVRCAFLCFGELTQAVPKHKGEFAGVHRDLIKNVGMIAVIRLSIG